MTPPSLHQDFGFGQAGEDLPVQPLVPQLEGFVVAVLPRAGFLDLEGLDADPAQPRLDRPRNAPARLGHSGANQLGIAFVAIWPLCKSLKA
jgi:hypothetical protein